MKGNLTTLGTADDIELRYGYYMFFSSIISFQLLNLLLSKTGNPKSVTEEPWRFRNMLISWLHALLGGIWNILCFWWYGRELMDDLILNMNYFIYLMIAFSTGYFAHDALDMIFNGKVLLNWEVSLHHVAVISCFWYNFHNKTCIGYNTLALMAEVNSFFLHSRKLLQMCKVSFDSVLYKVVIYSNLITFAGCRGWSVFKILYGMTFEYSRVSPVYYYILCVSMFIMTGINIILFWRLLRSDVLRDSNVPLNSMDKHCNGKKQLEQQNGKKVN